MARVPSPRLPGNAGLWIPGAGATQREGDPGIAGEKKWRGATDHGAGDPPCAPRLAEPACRAGLRVLQSALSPNNRVHTEVNGVVLKDLPNPLGGIEIY